MAYSRSLAAVVLCDGREEMPGGRLSCEEDAACFPSVSAVRMFKAVSPRIFHVKKGVSCCCPVNICRINGSCSLAIRMTVTGTSLASCRCADT